MPKLLRVCCLVFVFLLGGMVPSASAGWYQDGIEWAHWPTGSQGGINCFGNCGAGCSSSVNPCGGPQQHWTLEIIAGPDAIGTAYDVHCYQTSYQWGPRWKEHWTTYQAIGRWTYHGWVTPGCISHDATCNQWQIGCIVFFGCGSPGWTDEWSYDAWMTGNVYWIEELPDGQCNE